MEHSITITVTTVDVLDGDSSKIKKIEVRNEGLPANIVDDTLNILSSNTRSNIGISKSLTIEL